MPFTPGMERSLEVRVQSSGVDQFQNRMAAASSGLLTFRNSVGLAAGALSAMAAGSLVAAIDAARDFEEAMIEVQKVTDEETMLKMRDDVRALAQEIPLAQEELAGLAADAARFGIRGTENITSFTESVSKMAVATNIGAEKAGEALARIATLTDTAVGDVENLGSAINELSNNFATSADEVVDSMLRSGAALSQVGLQQTEIAALGAALNEVSESSRRAGTRLRRVAQEMLDPKKAEEIASALGMNADEFKRMRSESPVEVIQMMAQAFADGGETADSLRRTLSTASRQAIAGLAQNLDGMNRALETSQKSFEANTSLQREFEAQSNTLNNQLTLLRNNIRDSAIEIGQVFVPALTDMLSGVNDFLSANGTILDALSAQQKAWGLVATAVGGAAIALGTLVSGPIGAVVGGLGLLAGAFATNFLGIRDQAQMLAGTIGDTFRTMMSDINTGIVQPGLAQLRAFWADSGGAIISTAQNALSTLRGVIQGAIGFIVSNIWDPALAHITSLWESHFGTVLDETAATGSALQSIFQRVTSEIQALWSVWGDEVMAVANFVSRVVVARIVSAFDLMLTKIRVVLALIRGDFQDAWNLIVGFAERVGDRLANVFEGVPIFEDLVNAARDVGASMRDAMDTGDPFAALEAGANTAIDRIQSAFEDPSAVFGTLEDAADQAISAVQDAFGGVFDDLFGGDLGGAGNTLRDAFAGFQRVASTVQNALRQVLTVASNVMTFLVNNLFGPLVREIARIWRRHFGDVVRETQETMGAVMQYVRRVMNDVVPIIRTALAIIDQLWTQFGDEILAVVRFAFDAIVSVIGASLDAAITVLRTAMAVIRGDWGEAWNLIAGLAERVLGGVIDFIAEWGTGLAAEIWNQLTGMASGAADAAGDIADAIMDEIDSVIDGIADWGGDLIAGLVGAINDAKTFAVTAAENLVSDLKGALTNIGSAVASNIQNAINNALDLPWEHTIGKVKVQGETVFGGQTLRIPALQEGGIVEDETLAQIGEGGPEAVIPLDRMEGMGGGPDLSKLTTQVPVVISHLERIAAHTAKTNQHLASIAAQSGAATARVEIAITMPEGGGAFASAVREIVRVEVDDEFTNQRRRLERREQRGEA